jgi:hypothetical protein
MTGVVTDAVLRMTGVVTNFRDAVLRLFAGLLMPSGECTEATYKNVTIGCDEVPLSSRVRFLDARESRDCFTCQSRGYRSITRPLHMSESWIPINHSTSSHVRVVDADLSLDLFTCQSRRYRSITRPLHMSESWIPINHSTSSHVRVVDTDQSLDLFICQSRGHGPTTRGDHGLTFGAGPMTGASPSSSVH